MALLLRDAQQWTGLSAGPARSKAKRAWPGTARLSAVHLAKLAVRQPRGETDEPLAMARRKRRAVHQHRLDRICEHVAHGQRLEKSSPDYEALCNDGVITKEAA
jgi:hypothetical protein